VRSVCERFGELFGKPPQFTGVESDTALLSNATATLAELGPLRVPTDQLIEWVADWVAGGGRLLNKPTRFEARDGKF